MGKKTQDKKTVVLRLRCTEEEKKKMLFRAERTGKTFSEYARECLLNGEIVSVPQLTENEKEALYVLKRIAQFFTYIANLIKTKDETWVQTTKNLSIATRYALRRFYDARYKIPDEIYDMLSLKPYDCQM
ncbi:plasmid mobilization protein [Porphyromonas levii]|uniref:Plasmid mobilization relaxosome protein MobC n=1 Tax=Porphyromonas levii TaxID=28114 RepID=A0A4Y8WN29_9PORP|nr:hypothetical protein [Porphyromonas levii]MBR8703332.1 hypothetical protein [Porphyromonas levii]MBR8730355.1 hypothetical protein [Porphyromonas levii]MBR8764127.1 hypothetical protein [Porphyromonas levii]MBR8766481.1 hypothetical protein [Porphyromonas levii]MBR8770406.1 hypothetical protein [Porphyromonas levii]